MTAGADRRGSSPAAGSSDESAAGPLSLRAVLDRAEPREHGFALAIPPGWHQGRTAYGGFSAALALHAAQACGEDLPPLRSAQVAFVGPLAGEVSVAARVLRRGRNATWIAVEISGEGGVGLAATFVFMSPMASVLQFDRSSLPEDLLPPEDAPDISRQHRPAYIQNLEARYATAPSQQRRPEISWWLRHREQGALDPITEVISIADSVPPGVLRMLPAPVNVSTMTWLLNLLTPHPATRDGWWLLRSRGDFAQGGCASQDMQLWNADLEPVGWGMQSVALFG